MWSLITVLPLLGSTIGGVTRYKALPSSITRSFVNLGKMDVNFYINTKGDDKDFIQRQNQIHHQSLFNDEKPNLESPCHCSNRWNLESPSIKPSDIMDKILSNNDLFRTIDDVDSPCCQSHEVQEEIIIDLTEPKPEKPLFKPNSILTLPFTLNGLPKLPPKDIEIVFFPNKASVPLLFPKKNNIKKDAIKIVGDKIAKGYAREFTEVSDKVNPSVKKDLKIANPEINTETPEGKTTNVGDTNAL